MGFYKNPEEMFKARAKKAQNRGNAEWAQAKSGDGDYHFGMAKRAYNKMHEEEGKARDVRGKSWNDLKNKR